MVQICTTAKERLQTKQFHDKLDLYVDELYKVLRLLLLLSSRLARLDNAICLSNSATSKVHSTSNIEYLSAFIYFICLICSSFL